LRVFGPPHDRKVPLATINTTVAVVVLTGISLLLLWVLRIDVLYVVVAAFVALALSPAVHFLERHGLARATASTIVFLVGLLAFGGIVYAFSAPLIAAVTQFAHQVPTLVNQAEHGRGAIGRLVKRLHLQNWISTNAPKLSQDVTKIVKPAQALSVGAAAASTLFGLTTIAILSFFIMLEGPRIGGSMLGLLPPARAARVRRVYDDVTRSVAGYVLGDALTSVIAGVVVFVTLALLGVPFAPLLGLWVGLVDLLPLVGGLLAGIPTVLLAFIHSSAAGIVTLVVFIVYQQVENHLLNPLIMSRTVLMNPLWVLLSVLVGAKLGGQINPGLGDFVGALLGIPVGGAVQVIIRDLRHGATGALEHGDPGPSMVGRSPGVGTDTS
jgi:predicted PurR-regulated permease PerM